MKVAGTILNKINFHFGKAVLYYLLAVSFLFTVDYLRLRALPLKYWIEYKSVEPVKIQYTAGETIRFVSKLDVNESAEVEWLDILRCQLNGEQESTFFSIYKSNVNQLMVGKDKESIWNYLGKTPQETATCFLDSNHKLNLNYGITKNRSIKSGFFEIEG